tara:strand:- start:304 stop:507 length:204 start_codon:yes stop_codon:yes gene_type:complete
MIKDSIEHLKSVNESYFKHFKIASRIGILMIIGGFQAILHAIFPGILKTSASDKIKKLHNQVLGRND